MKLTEKDRNFLSAMRILDEGDSLPEIPVDDNADLIRRIKASVDSEMDAEGTCFKQLIDDNNHLQTSLITALRLKREAETDAKLTRITALVVFAVSCVSVWLFTRHC